MSNKENILQTIISFLSGIVLLNSVIVMFGWFSANKAIIQIHPSLAPMQFNSALSLFLVSLAIFFLNKKNEKVAIKISILALIIPVITLCEYLFNLDLAIDNFFFEGPIIEKNVDHLNRMSFITTISFILVGLSLVFIQSGNFFKILPTLSLYLALISFFNYIFNIEGSVLSNLISGMALHTSLSFIIISISTLLIYLKKDFSVVQKLPHVVFFILTLLSITAWQFSDQENEENFTTALEKIAQDEITTIKIKISQYEQALLGAKGFVKGSNFVSFQEWKSYINSINVTKNLSGLNGIGLIDYVDEKNINNYVKKFRREGLENFNNFPSTNFKNKFVIRYIEPIDINKTAVGLDIGFEKNRRKAAETSIDSGVSTLTDIIYLVQDEKSLPGFLLLVPIYKNEEKIFGSIKKRRENIIGWIYTPFIAKSLIEDSSYLKNNLSSFKIYSKNNELIYSNSNKSINDKEIIKTIDVFGKEWTMIFSPTEEFIASNHSNYPYLVLIVGLFLSSLIYFGIYSISKLYGYSAKKTSDLSKILEVSHNEIFIFDIKTFKYIFANNGACDNLGYSLKELRNMTPMDIKPEYSNEDLLSLFQPLISGCKEKITIETLHQRKDKTTYNAEIYIQKGQYLGKDVFVAIIIDSTKRKKSEMEVKEAKNFLELINNNIPDLIFVKDENFVIIQANKSFLDLYPEDKKDKVIGYTTFEDYDFEEKEEFLKMDKKAFEKGYSETNETINFPDGTKRTLFTQKIRFKNLKGEKFILGIARDITEKEHLINKLSDANEELQNFAYICSHDLQEPLRMVRSFSNKLETHLENEIKEDQKAKTYLNFITDGAKRGQNLVSDILDYSSINNDLNINEKIDLMEMMSVLTNNLSSNLEDKELEIKYDKLPTIKGSKTQIYQLLMNLITNSIKYQKEGNKPVINVKVADEKYYWKISIQDNGIGIKDEHFNKIFDIFKRLHAKSEYAGTGIGLSICKKVVKNHGGDIWIDSTEGIGSTFHFTIKKPEKKI